MQKMQIFLLSTPRKGIANCRRIMLKYACSPGTSRGPKMLCDQKGKQRIDLEPVRNKVIFINGYWDQWLKTSGSWIKTEALWGNINFLMRTLWRSQNSPAAKPLLGAVASHNTGSQLRKAGRRVDSHQRKKQQPEEGSAQWASAQDNLPTMALAAALLQKPPLSRVLKPYIKPLAITLGV